MNLGPHDIAELANHLKSVRTEEAREIENILELKGCGANKPGGGGFSAGNTCARGGGGGGESFHKGDKVTISNAKQYDALSKTDKIEGTVDFVFPGGNTVAVKVGAGQYNVDPKHLTIRKS